jgi:hypothetical protein
MEQLDNKYKDYELEGLETLATKEQPIAGQSLVNSPDQQYPWESPPEFTELQPAIEATFLELTEDEMFFSIVNLLRNNLSVGEVTQIILYDGFTKGMWNPDLMLLLVEPVMYMVLSLAERAGIQDVKIYKEQNEEPSSQEEQVKGLNKAIEAMQKTVVPKLSKKSIPDNISKKIEEFIPPKKPSLLEAPEQEEIENVSEKNLLDKGVSA